MKRLLLLLTAAAALLLGVSCERRPLEVYDYNYARLRLDVDWDTYFTETPSGMTVMIFDSLGQHPVTTVTNNVHQAFVTLPMGFYQAVVFNQSFDEFGSMHFENTGLHELIAARSTNIVTHESADWDRGVTYMREPEAIGVAIDTFSVTPAMLTENITLHPWTRSVPEPQGDGLYVVRDSVYPMTSTLYIRVLIRGMQNMRAVEGSISGMADGFLLSQIWRTEQTGTLLLDNWRTNQVSDDGTEGWITTSTPTFGLPHGKELEAQRYDEDNVITLHFTLRDGTTRDFRYNVGKYIKYRNEGHLVDANGNLIATLAISAHAQVVLDLELVIEAPLFDVPVLPDVQPSGGGGGGFDAHVDEWEDGGTIDIGF